MFGRGNLDALFSRPGGSRRHPGNDVSLVLGNVALRFDLWLTTDRRETAWRAF